MLCDSGRCSIHVSGFLGVTSSPLVHQVLLGVLAPAGFAFEFGEIDDEVGFALEISEVDGLLGLALELGEVPQAFVVLGLALELGLVDQQVGLALEFGHIDLDLCFAFEISAINNLRRCGQADQRQN